jgi:hypothetical protein
MTTRPETWRGLRLVGSGRPRFAGASFLAILLVAGLSGCSTKQPVLYPNPHLQRVGPEVAQADIAACLQLAEQQLQPDRTRDAAERTATGAVVGGATGAAVGAVTGHPGRGAGAGAAGGATRSLMNWLFGRRDQDPLVRSYTEHCLRERGYQTLGWR